MGLLSINIPFFSISLVKFYAWFYSKRFILNIKSWPNLLQNTGTDFWYFSQNENFSSGKNKCHDRPHWGCGCENSPWAGGAGMGGWGSSAQILGATGHRRKWGPWRMRGLTTTDKPPRGGPCSVILLLANTSPLTAQWQPESKFCRPSSDVMSSLIPSTSPASFSVFPFTATELAWLTFLHNFWVTCPVLESSLFLHTSRLSFPTSCAPSSYVFSKMT